DPRATAPDLLRRALAGLPQRARASGRVAVRADGGYFGGQLARAAHDENIAFAIGAKRIAPLWRLLAGLTEDDWHDAIEMDNAQVAVAQYCPDWWPADTRPDPPGGAGAGAGLGRSEEHTSELQSRGHLVCRLLLEKKKKSEITSGESKTRIFSVKHYGYTTKNKYQ